jgi:hypothetical protein
MRFEIALHKPPGMVPGCDADVAQRSPLEIRSRSLRISLRTVKPPPHEVGGSSWLGVALDPIVDCGQSS